MSNIVSAELKKLMSNFPGSFINQNLELILIPKTNAYFLIDDCTDKRDNVAKILMWCSRTIDKGQPYKNELKNQCFRDNYRTYLNSYLGTNFSREDIAKMYQKLGNGVRKKLTYKFIDSGFEMELLNE